MANIFETAEFLKYVCAMMESAVGRLIATACTAVDQGCVGDGKLPIRFDDVEARPTLVKQAALTPTPIGPEA
jgi:hypothetical protein